MRHRHEFNLCPASEFNMCIEETIRVQSSLLEGKAKVAKVCLCSLQIPDTDDDMVYRDLLGGQMTAQ